MNQEDGPLLALIGGVAASLVPGVGAAGAKSIGGCIGKLGNAGKAAGGGANAVRVGQALGNAKG
jgi:hypothetical protein